MARAGGKTFERSSGAVDRKGRIRSDGGGGY
jgi:hypothetical protein